MAVKILIVDDASFTRDLIRRTLRKQFPSADIEDAINGKKAQQMMSRNQFDMILCDWEMPEMTGLELLVWCRENENYQKADVPFVMITSRGDKDHVVEAVKHGVTDYLGKPFSSEQLINKVLSAAKKHNLTGKLTAQESRGSKAEKEAIDNLTNSTKSLSGHASGSLDVLLGAGGKTASASNTPELKATASKNTNKDVKIPTLVRFSGKQFRTMVIQFSRTEASLLIKSDDVIPSVLDQAVLDLEFNKEINRLNYYVQSVATTDKKSNSAFLTVVLGLIDQDAEKEKFINNLFKSL